MRTFAKLLVGAALTAGSIGLFGASANAAIVCSGNVCWHTHDTYDYPRDARVVIHDDNWHWGPHEHFAFREHEGRGYWRGDSWTSW